MTANVEQVRELVAEVREALLEAEEGAASPATKRRLRKLHRLLRRGLPLIADHFGAPVETFSGGEEKPDDDG